MNTNLQPTTGYRLPTTDYRLRNPHRERRRLREHGSRFVLTGDTGGPLRELHTRRCGASPWGGLRPPPCHAIRSDPGSLRDPGLWSRGAKNLPLYVLSTIASTALPFLYCTCGVREALCTRGGSCALTGCQYVNGGLALRSFIGCARGHTRHLGRGDHGTDSQI